MTPASGIGLDGKKIVFIVGSPRSGTTWLQHILSESPHVVTSPETHVFDGYLRPINETWRLQQHRGVGLSCLMTQADIDEWTGSFAKRCLERIAQTQPEASIVVEKTPSHGKHAFEILHVFPRAHIIHIIRDPRAVAASLRAVDRPWAPRQLLDACQVWQSNVLKAKEFASLTPNYMEVFYERLNTDGPRAVAQIYAAIGLDVTDAQAEAHLAQANAETLRPTKDDVRPRNAPYVRPALRRGQVGGWRAELTPTEIAMVERLTRKQMATLGYEPVSGRRARMAAKMRLKTYRAADRFAKAARAGADRLKP